MNDNLLRTLVEKAESAYRETRGAGLTTEFVLSEKHALTLLLAVRKVCGADVVTWEPESIWLLHDFSLENRDKLQAAKTLSTHPTLFTEPRGFAAIAAALTGHVPDFYEVTPPPPEAMAWAVLEGELIFSLANPDAEVEYSPDVVEFIAVTLAHEGFVCAPEMLEFADDRLAEHLSEDGKKLRTKVQAAWKELPLDALEEHPFPESAEGVQLARLAAVQVYCDRQTHSLLSELP